MASAQEATDCGGKDAGDPHTPMSAWEAYQLEVAESSGLPVAPQQGMNVNGRTSATRPPSPSSGMKSKRKEPPSSSTSGAARKPVRRKCNREGCPNVAKRGGVCARHGAKAKRCGHEGCASVALKGGVCVKHGARTKRCRREGCDNQAQKGGVCVRHGANVPRRFCKREGCANQALKGGVCVRHGAKRAKCAREGCSNRAQWGGVCIRHGPKRTCSKEGCTNSIVKGGVCGRHGAKRQRRICGRKGCSYQTIKGGVCIRHRAKRALGAQEGGTDPASNEDSDGGRTGRRAPVVNPAMEDASASTNPCIGHNTTILATTQESSTRTGENSKPRPKNVGICVTTGSERGIAAGNNANHDAPSGGGNVERDTPHGDDLAESSIFRLYRASLEAALEENAILKAVLRSRDDGIAVVVARKDEEIEALKSTVASLQMQLDDASPIEPSTASVGYWC